MVFSEMLAQAERDMDAGVVPFVVIEGVGRTLVQPEIFKRLELKQGQTISWTLFGEILKLSLEETTKKLAKQQAEKQAEQDEVLAQYEMQMRTNKEW